VTRPQISKTRAMLPLIILIVIAAGMVTLSSYYLFRAYLSYREGAMESSIYYAVIGATGIAITVYMTFIMRKRTVMKKAEVPVLTTTECAKCSYKSLRKFAKGDYVYRTVGTCEKCSEPMLITAIYAEPPQKKQKQQQ
jgi:uncharacterized membrane protein YuzA (DUF378 family)